MFVFFLVLYIECKCDCIDEKVFFIFSLGVIGLIVFLIFCEFDYVMMVFVVFIGVVMIFFVGLVWKIVFGVGLFGVVGFVVFVFLESY